MDFEQSCKEAKKTALSFKNPLIIFHYDTDGITSGSIVISAFREKMQKHRSKWIKKLDNENFEKLEKEKEIIFVDLGGGNERVNELKDVLIIDHHQTKNIEKLQINPLLFGMDGGTELSAAGTAYSVFQNHIDLAIVGAVGDMQYPLIGKNRELLEKGIKEKKLELLTDLKLYGRSSRPLPQFLAYSDDVYIPGITNREENVYKLLEDLKIEVKDGERLRNYIDLNEKERKKLISTLINILIENNKKPRDLIGEVYLLKTRPLKSDLYDASEFSTILNACGRHGYADLGVQICLEEKGAYEKGLELLKLHKQKIREGIEFAKANMQDFSDFYFLNGIGVIDEGIIGIVCGMVLPYNSKKPMFGVSLGENNTLKISGRANRKLIEEGINLGSAISKVCKSVGGSGGGHSIAAGASIQRNSLNEFLKEIGKIIRQRT